MPPISPTGLQALSATSSRQYGLFTADQARSVGIAKALLERRLKVGDLVAVDYGVYRSVLTPVTWHQRLLAACLAGPAVASHRSAAVLWGLLDDESRVEVTAVRHRRRTSPDVTWHESYLLDPTNITEISGVPVTSAARTVLDLAGVLDEGSLQRVVDEALRRRLASVASLGRMLERLGPLRVGAQTMRKVLEHRLDSSVPESDLETQFELLLRAHGLPTATPQHTVVAPDGRRLRIDYAFVEAMVGVELLGARFHAQPDRWSADIERLGVLAALGWWMLSFSYDQVTQRPTTVVRAVELALRNDRGSEAHR